MPSPVTFASIHFSFCQEWTAAKVSWALWEVPKEESGRVERPMTGVVALPAVVIDDLIVCYPWRPRWALGEHTLCDRWAFQSYSNYLYSNFRMSWGIEEVRSHLFVDGDFHPSQKATAGQFGYCYWRNEEVLGRVSG